MVSDPKSSCKMSAPIMAASAKSNKPSFSKKFACSRDAGSTLLAAYVAKDVHKLHRRPNSLEECLIPCTILTTAPRSAASSALRSLTASVNTTKNGTKDVMSINLHDGLSAF